jgi:NADPH-dependent glutamate synthase beta subunit-like oxidoreductase
MAKANSAPETKIETHKYGAKIASTKKTKGGEFTWSKDRCTGCIRCAQRCPVDAIVVDRQKDVAKKVGISPCSQGCPAGVDIPRYLRYIAERKYPEAVAVNRERIPFPSVCGYICMHPCEAKCQRSQIDEHILIRALKRYAATHDTGLWKQGFKDIPPTGKRVAVIGSGPAGLTTAYYLKRKGHAVTVFEAAAEPGGKMMDSVPPYDLPKDVLKAEIKEIEDIGVEIKTNTRVDSAAALLEQGYDAVLVAVGTGKGLPLPISGIELDGVLDGDAFLKDIGDGKEVKLGKRVVVLGGGTAAFNAALEALHHGATDVHMFGMEHQGDSETDPWAVDQALEEGVVTHPWYTFARVVSSDGRAEGVESSKIRSFGFDKEGEFLYDTIPGSEELITADTVIAAIGGKGEGQDKAAALVADREGLFAAGDAVNEQRSVVEAIAAGRWAAVSIDKYLGGSGDITETLAPPVQHEKVVPLRSPKGGLPPEVPTRLICRNVDGTCAEEEMSLAEKEVIKEAKRCLRCDIGYPVDEFEVDTLTCTYCGRCVDACYWDAILAGVGYEKAAKERKEELEETAIKYRLQDRVLTILVVSVAIIALGIVAVKLLAS